MYTYTYAVDCHSRFASRKKLVKSFSFVWSTIRIEPPLRTKSRLRHTHVPFLAILPSRSTRRCQEEAREVNYSRSGLLSNIDKVVSPGLPT